MVQVFSEPSRRAVLWSLSPLPCPQEGITSPQPLGALCKVPWWRLDPGDLQC